MNELNEYRKERTVAMNNLRLITSALIVIGALNWGLVALAGFDLVAWIAGLSFGSTNLLSRLVYGLVALAGLYEASALVMQRRRHQHRHATA